MLAITESWLKGTDKDKAVISELIPPGFKLHHVARPKKRGGGVAVIYRSSIGCKKLEVSVKMSQNLWKCHDAENIQPNHTSECDI